MPRNAREAHEELLRLFDTILFWLTIGMICGIAAILVLRAT